MRCKDAIGIAKRVAIILGSLAVSAAAVAAPYSISYTGTISNSDFPGIVDGQPFTVTVVVDNGGGTTGSQTWDGSHLRCVLWTMNSAANVRYSQDLAATLGTLSVSGAIVTDGAGSLISNFSELYSENPPAGTYSATGITLVRPISWFLNDANSVFFDSSRQFADAAGGVQMADENWSDPQPFAGTCPVQAAVPAPVPTLSEWAAIAMSGLLALAACFAHRRRRQTRH